MRVDGAFPTRRPVIPSARVSVNRDEFDDIVPYGLPLMVTSHGAKLKPFDISVRVVVASRANSATTVDLSAVTNRALN